MRLRRPDESRQPGAASGTSGPGIEDLQMHALRHRASVHRAEAKADRGGRGTESRIGHDLWPTGRTRTIKVSNRAQPICSVPPSRYGMRYAIVIWFAAAFVLWDTQQNNSQYTRPVAHVVYRIAGGY